jgi:hypothetical protein
MLPNGNDSSKQLERNRLFHINQKSRVEGCRIVWGKSQERTFGPALPQIVGPGRARRRRDQQLAPLNQGESPQLKKKRETRERVRLMRDETSATAASSPPPQRPRFQRGRWGVESWGHAKGDSQRSLAIWAGTRKEKEIMILIGTATWRCRQRPKISTPQVTPGPYCWRAAPNLCCSPTSLI